MAVKVTANLAELDASLSRLVDAAINEIGKTVIAIADDIGGTTQATWYTQVKRRTGRTGGALDTRMSVKNDRLQAVVYSRDKTTYMVKRPGPLSGQWKPTTSEEYAKVASYYRRTGEALPGYKFSVSKVDGHLYRVFRWEKNPLAADGKNIWNELVNKEGKKTAEARAPEIEAALERAVRMLGRG